MPARYARTRLRATLVLGTATAVAASGTLLSAGLLSASAGPVTLAASSTAAGTITGPANANTKTVSGLRLKQGAPAAVMSHATVAAPGPAVTPLKTFTKSFVYNGHTYPYTMVGTDPKGAAVTTTIPVSLIPVKVVIGGFFFTPTGAITATTASKLFTNTTWTAGPTSLGNSQYGDATFRASFWNWVKNKNWHVKLGTPTVKPTVTFNVPASQGGVYQTADGSKVALIQINWWDTQVQAVTSSYGVSQFPNLLAYQVVLCSGAIPSTCGIGGYHSAIPVGGTFRSYSYASWVTASVYGTNGSDLAAMSHEISEWYNDPFVNNKAPKWTSPLSPQYGCTDALETGDPLVGKVVKNGGLNYQDEALLSFFTRQTPSIGVNGWYSVFGTFKTYSKAC